LALSKSFFDKETEFFSEHPSTLPLKKKAEPMICTQGLGSRCQDFLCLCNTCH